MSAYRYRLLEVSNETVVLRDDGYRIESKWLEPATADSAAEWTLVCDYKQCDYPAVGRAVADALMGGK